MTLNTNERERARPVEGLARVLFDEVAGGDADELIHHPAQKSWEEPTEPRWSQFAESAQAVLAYLVSHGWLTPEYFEARKAEEKAAESGRNVDVSA